VLVSIKRKQFDLSSRGLKDRIVLQMLKTLDVLSFFIFTKAYDLARLYALVKVFYRATTLMQ